MTKKDILDGFHNTPAGCKPQSMSLGTMVGMTQTAETLEAYNRQFSKDFVKYGIMGKQTKNKKNKTYTIILHKRTNTVSVKVHNVVTPSSK